MLLKKIAKKILLSTLTMSLIISTCTSPILASTTSAKSGLTLPVYDSTWGYDFPTTIGKKVRTSPIKDVLAIDFKFTDKFKTIKPKLLLPIEDFNFAYTLIGIYNVNPPGGDGGFAAADIYADVYKNEIHDIVDNTGKSVPKDNYNRPISDKAYIDSLRTGDVMYTVLFKKDSKIAKSFMQSSTLYWEKVKSSVIQPKLTGKISHAFNSGVSISEAYSFAKTLGSSKGITIGGQLKGGPNSSNGGVLSVNYTHTISQSITNTFSRSTTVTSSENTTVDYTYENIKDHPVAIAIYRPVEVFSVRKTGSNKYYQQMLEALDKWSEGTLSISLPDSYTYNHSDFVSLISN